MEASSAAVDVHAHVVPRSLLAELEAGPASAGGFAARRTGKGWVVTVPGVGDTRPIGARMTDPGPRREWMSKVGVTEQVLSPWMDVQFGRVPSRDWARRLNDAMAQAAQELGGSRTLATVSTADGEAAAADLQEAWSRPETAGVLLSTDPLTGPAPHDPSLDPFWEEAEREAIPVMLHPPTCGPSNDLPTLGGMGNVHGRLIDNTLAITRLILNGLLDRHPRLVLVLVHGGGYLPYQAVRLDGGYRTRESFAGELAKGRPSAYLSDLYFDTAALSGPAIAFLTGLVGADRVLLGSDYPFALGDPEPVLTVRAAGLPARETDAILRANAGRIYGRSG